jgi:type I restriction-modification system DNA methylase subunit
MPKDLFQPALFNQSLVKKRMPALLTPPAHKKILHDWAAAIRDGSIHKQKESSIRGPFIRKFFVELLGYKPFGEGDAQWTVHEEQQTGPGSADAALGQFDAAGRRVVVPVELKGADTPNLDAIMPGRHKSPVQQAWEYANDTKDCQWVLLSNMLEIRLYAISHTRQVFERWDILDLADSDAEYQRFRLILGADNLLGGATAQLLKDSAGADKEITQSLYRDYRQWRQTLIIALAQSNPGLPFPAIIEHAQTILDRVLFVAFAEDRELLPAHTLAQAFDQRNPFSPQPIWENFKGLFRFIDQGNPVLHIPAYNGGLFRADPALDHLILPDDACRMFKALGDYDFASEVGVTVLGHIFEQSIADLEELHQLAGGDALNLDALQEKAATSRSVSGKRKEEGVVYTPDGITAFIVEQTLGCYLNDRRETLRAAYLDPKAASGEVRYRASTAAEKKSVKVRDAARLAEFLFWHAWREALSEIRVLDPACGSGAFLIAAFDVLDAEYRQVNEQIQAITGNPDLFDINREILNRNLYGVDLNPESIEITKLSLWLKTARYGKPLQSLEANLRVGNSLIADAAWTPRPFDWSAAFPEAIAAGGFDVVLGNPPYVRMERLKSVKPYLEKHYAVASDRADLYCYFFELGVRLLKPGGRLGYISSSTFFKTGSGEPLRRYLLANTRLQVLVDFGDLQVFAGVTTYPAIVILERSETPDPAASIRQLVLKTLPEPSLAAVFGQQAGSLPQARLSAGSWQLEDDARAGLRAKLLAGHPTLKDIYGPPLYGIKTGFNEAFVVDRGKRDELIAADPNSAELLKPFLEGKDLKKWRIEPQDLWLIYIPRGRIAIDEYPAIRDHLLPYKDKLEQRATKQAWFELQQAQENYRSDFDGPKLIYPEISQGPKFNFDSAGKYLSNKIFYLATQDRFLIGLLNSRVGWHFLFGICSPLRGGEWRLELRAQYVETFPVPLAGESLRSEIAAQTQGCLQAAETRRNVQAAFRRRIPDLSPAGSVKLPGKLERWWEIDFAAFRSEVKKAFRQDIPLAERNDWENFLNAERARVRALDDEIARREKAIDRAVYSLFALTAAEIALIEGAAA